MAREQGVAPASRAMERRQIAWTAAAMIFGGAPHMFSVVPWVPLLVLSIAAWRIAAAARGWSLPSLWIRAPVTVLGFLGVLASYRSVSGVEAGSALLLVMAGMKLLETRAERDRVLVVFIGYFLLFAMLLREQAIWSLAWLAGGTVGITTALMQVVRREAVLPLAPAAALSARLMLQALPLAALLFVLFPRIPGPFWAMSNTSLAGVTGLNDHIEPGDMTELSLSDEVAFRVRFEGEVPPAESLYWRGPVLERFDGRRWSALPVPPHPPAPRVTPSPGPQFGYQLVLEPQGKRWLLALETPLSWSIARATLGQGLQLLNAEPFWERLSYRARSVTSGVTMTQASAENLAVNLRLPAGRNPRATALARQLRREAGDDRAFLARALQVYGDHRFLYSLTPPPLGPDSVDEFLFGTRTGYCEHYAASLAVLARAGGVPARVVVGYQGGERNPFGDYWIVRQANAHAWVEVWIDNAWRRVDPTATVAPERIEGGIEQSLAASPMVSGRLWRSNILVNRMVLSWDALNAGWDRWVLAFGPEMQENLLLALGFTVPRIMQLTAMAGAATVACMLVMGLAIRRHHRKRRDRPAVLYGRVCRKLALVVRPRALAETAAHYADAVVAARPDLEPEVRALTRCYLELRYGGRVQPELERRMTKMVRNFRPRVAPASR